MNYTAQILTSPSCESPNTLPSSGISHPPYKENGVTHTLLLLSGLGLAVLPSDSKTVPQIEPNDPLLYAFDQIKEGMSERKALGIIGRKIGSGGSEASAPDFQWYRFAEWYGKDYMIRVLTRDGRVIKKVFQSLKE